MSPAGLSAR